MSYFPRLKKESGEVNILLVSTIIFGIVAFIFSITSIYAVLDAQNVHRNLNSEKAASFSAGKDEQKKQDVKDTLAANESPFRSYKAPNEFGNFEVKFPKNWNAWVTQNVSATTQVNLVLNPEIIKVVGDTAQSGNNYAFRALLVRQSSDTVKQQLDQRVKAKKMTSKTVKVGGIASTWYEGAPDDHHTGVTVVIPVRDKTLEFITDYSKDYLNEFNQILAQAIIPT